MRGKSTDTISLDTASEIDITKSDSKLSSLNSSLVDNSETESEVDENVGSENEPNSENEHADEQLSEYRGFKMQYPKRSKRSRARKLRPTNYVKGTNQPLPPSGKKTSKGKVYNEPDRVNVLIKQFNTHRVEKRVNKKTKEIVKVACTPEPFINSAGMLFCNCCREVLSIHKGTVAAHCATPKH